jgi:hypothetical protein
MKSMTHTVLLRGTALTLALLLAACAQSATDAPPTVRVADAPLTLAVQGDGELRAIKATPLLVPGPQWTPRQLAWMLPDGSQVKKDEVIARFSAEQSKQDLAQALVDLQRNLLARAGKQAELGANQGQLGVDLSDVATQLAIARRYANAGIQALARNKVLDAVQDEHFLGTKQGILDWRRDQSGSRGKAELAVLDAQHATYDLNEKQKRSDLDALELRAPHDGVLVLETDWSGAKPSVGGSMWASNAFGSLPDTSAMEVQIAVPQVQAQGIKSGDSVELHPLGLPAQTVTSKLSWVAEAAQSRSRSSPVKYLLMKALVPAAAVQRYAWVPGQHFAARVILFESAHALSVPNLAIDSSGDSATVTVREGNATRKRTIRLGVRGATRSQVLDGVKAGDEVVLDVSVKNGGTKEAAP